VTLVVCNATKAKEEKAEDPKELKLAEDGKPLLLLEADKPSKQTS